MRHFDHLRFGFTFGGCLDGFIPKAAVTVYMRDGINMMLMMVAKATLPMMTATTSRNSGSIEVQQDVIALECFNLESYGRHGWLSKLWSLFESRL